jgi:hypothetical protein
MASTAHSMPAPLGATTDIVTAARAIACLAEIVDTRLSDLRRAVEQHGAGASQVGDWDDAALLLHLAIEQANAIERTQTDAAAPC